MAIENEKRFEEAKYLLKPFRGNVFPDLNGLTAFLKSLEIGVMNKSSYNFYSVKSFIIEGMEQYFSGW